VVLNRLALTLALSRERERGYSERERGYSERERNTSAS
jgi:hypothetical protein